MIDEAAAANRLFGASMKPAEAPAQQPAQKPAQQAQTAAERIFSGPEPYKAPSEPQQQKPAQEGKAPEQPKPGEQPQQPEVIAKVAEEITSTLAEHGFDPAHADTTSFGKLAAELGLKADGAKRLAEWDQQRSEAAWDKLADDWHTKAKGDPLYSDNVTAGHSLIQEFGDDRLMQEVIDVGYGNHPAVIAFMGRVGRALEQARRNRR